MSKRKNFWGELWGFLQFGWPYIVPYRERFFLGIALGIFFGVVTGAFVYVTKFITARLESSDSLEAADDSWLEQTRVWIDLTLDPWLPLVGRPLDAQQILGGICLVAVLTALRGSVGYLSSYCMAWTSERVILDLRCRVVEKLNSLSLEYFHRKEEGELLTRINTDTTNLQKALSLGLSDLVKEPVTLLSVLICLIWIDWQLAVIGFVFMPMTLIPIFVLGRKVRKASRGQREANVSQSNLILQSLANIRVVKAFQLEQARGEEFRQHSNRLRTHNMRGTKSKELINPVIETIASLAFGVILVYVFYSGYQVADLAGFLMALILSYTPVKKLASLHVLLQQTSVGIERLMELFDEKPKVQDGGGAVDLQKFDHAIEFRDVSFSYGDGDVLSGLNLKVPRGKKVGIVGETGSGKSTIVNLLLRFYDVTKGSILIDGQDLREVTLSSLRGATALVSQEVLLFNQSVSENIGHGRLGASQAEIEKAARAAHAHSFIEKMEDGYGTLVGEWGVRLSGGQRQRVAIARAFLRDAPILILDEATSALDSASEEIVQEAIDGLAKDRTVVAVAHRLATLKGFDWVVVLEGGKVVEEGSFDELLSSEGRFGTMARRQGLK